MMGRAESILSALPETGTGIEYSPLSRPLVRNSEIRTVRYVDFTDRAELTKRYANVKLVDTNEIPDIVIVTGGRLIDEFLPLNSLDFVVASHVAEHVPDQIGWLKANLEVLRPHGRITIAYPDRRYCFDYGKNSSMVSDLLAAHLESRTRPTFQQICDHHFNNRRVTPQDIWSNGVTPASVEFVHDRTTVLPLLKRLRDRTDYIDAHC